ARHGADRFAPREHRVAGSREPTLQEPEPHEPSEDARFLLAPQRVASDEVALVDLRDPAEARLEHRVLLVEGVPVERITHLQAQAVARAEPRRTEALRATRLEERPPQGGGFRGGHVELEAVLARVARAAHD